MSAENDGQEKTHEASPARLAKARREGDVPQSREANAAASYIGLYLALTLGAGGGAAAISAALWHAFNDPEYLAAIAFSAGPAGLNAILLTALGGAALIFALPAGGALASLLAQQSISFAPSRLKPNLSRLSIVANAKKKFGPEGLTEFAKSAVKLIGVFFMFGVVFVGRLDALPQEALFPAQRLAEALLAEAIVFLGLIVLFSVAVAAVDLPWSRQQHAKRLRMSFEEMKRESKENDGDPTMKQNRRSRAQAIATNRMLRDVPKADVVIVNPSHYAVALQWDREQRGAPKCIAKGVDEVAARIREVAALSGVPIRRDPPTARAIHASVKVGEEIHREHFAAVAAAIHFADAMRAKARHRG